MGAWGVNLLDDDTAADVYGDYIERYNAGAAHDAIAAAMVSEFLLDDDEHVSVWLGIAKAQWDCGALAEGTAAEVRRIVDSGQDRERWTHLDKKTQAARERAMRQFLDKLDTPNPRPKKRRKGIIRKPIFQPGDCLSIRLPDGDYAAAIVTAAPEESRRPGADTYGINVVALLDYKEPTKPTAEVFERRQILRLTHHNWKNNPEIFQVMALRFKVVRDQFEVVGKTVIRPEDPVSSGTFTGWGFAEQMVEQRKWDAGERS